MKISDKFFCVKRVNFFLLELILYSITWYRLDMIAIFIHNIFHSIFKVTLYRKFHVWLSPSNLLFNKIINVVTGKKIYSLRAAGMKLSSNKKKFFYKGNSYYYHAGKTFHCSSRSSLGCKTTVKIVKNRIRINKPHLHMGNKHVIEHDIMKKKMKRMARKTLYSLKLIFDIVCEKWVFFFNRRPSNDICFRLFSTAWYKNFCWFPVISNFGFVNFANVIIVPSLFFTYLYLNSRFINIFLHFLIHLNLDVLGMS